MRKAVRHIGRDLKNRRNIEAYAVAGLALTFAVLSIVGEVVTDELRWAALLAGVGLLVYRLTLPSEISGAEGLLFDRVSFDQQPFTTLLTGAQEVWVFAPTAINLLSPRTCDVLRSQVLAKKNAVVRIVVLNPAEQEALLLAAKQLDDSLDYPTQRLAPSLAATLNQLELMCSWPVPGSLEYRLLDYSPGFSLVAIDPGKRRGKLIIEFHGFHNETVTSRMHLELTREISQQWYSYWVNQFDHIWQAAKSHTSLKDTASYALPPPER